MEASLNGSPSLTKRLAVVLIDQIVWLASAHDHQYRQCDRESNERQWEEREDGPHFKFSS